MTLPNITPEQAKAKIERDEAILVDIREPMEYARESIPGATSIPLGTIDSANVRKAASAAARPVVIFHCQGGRRTAENAERLGSCIDGEAFILDGGLSGWKSAGYPTNVDWSKPIDLQRQVQIIAGSLILAGLG